MICMHVALAFTSVAIRLDCPHLLLCAVVRHNSHLVVRLLQDSTAFLSPLQAFQSVVDVEEAQEKGEKGWVGRK